MVCGVITSWALMLQLVVCSGVGSVAAVAAMAATLFGKKKKKESEMIAEAERRCTQTHNSGNHTYSKLRTDYACALVSARFYFSARCEF